MERKTREVRVWDPLVRIFHWSIVLLVVTAFWTEDDIQRLHVPAGYAVFALIIARIFWGFWGPRHARLSDFVFPPRRVITYLKDLVRLRAPRYLGHGPAGGAMVVALLVNLMGVTLSGLVVYGGQEYEGPLAGLMTPVDTLWISAAETIHELFAGTLLVLVGLHVAGVLFSSFAHRENLIRAMLTGTKRAADAHPDRTAVPTTVRAPSPKGIISLPARIVAILLFAAAGSAGVAEAAVIDDLLQTYRKQGAAEFDPASGKTLWTRTFVDPGTKEERSCATCHRADLRTPGEQANTGKPIEPMAPSVNAKRLTDPKFIEKWFNRNCKWTLGRECTPTEKGNILLFLRGQ